jgi:glutamate racemase
LKIGVFDSGLGGLSVLQALQAQLPAAAFHYIADSGHAPYGERDDAHVMARSLAIVAYLVSEGAELIVIACNTATAIAVQALRSRWPALPIVGIEPGLKPAAAATRNGRIGVMATRNTLASTRFAALLAGQSAPERFHLQACDGLAAAIEAGRLEAPELLGLVARHTEPLRRADVDTVVLGCTHYAFVREHIARALGPAVRIIDTADAVARQAARLADRAAAATAPAACAPRLQTSASPETLQRLAKAWLGLDGVVSAAPTLMH